MNKTLVKEFPFGKKAIARVTVSGWSEEVNLDGILTGSIKVNTTSRVEIIMDGKVFTKSFGVDVLEYDRITDTYFDKMGLDHRKKYTRVYKAVTEGEETGLAIKAAIAEMTAEIEKELQGVSEVEKQEQEAIEIAKEVVELAEKEGIENLLTTAELKVWRIKYNNLYNEGGEGYVPTRISREQYEKQREFLTGKGVI